MSANPAIVHCLGKPIKIKAGASGDVRQDEAGNGEAIAYVPGGNRYSYNPDGMLTDAIFSSGRERHYSYQGVLLTQISDEKGNVIRNWYDPPRLVRQQFGNGAIYSWDYDWSANTYCPDKVVVTLANDTGAKRYESAIRSPVCPELPSVRSTSAASHQLSQRLASTIKMSGVSSNSPVSRFCSRAGS